MRVGPRILTGSSNVMPGENLQERLRSSDSLSEAICCSAGWQAHPAPPAFGKPSVFQSRSILPALPTGWGTEPRVSINPFSSANSGAQRGVRWPDSGIRHLHTLSCGSCVRFSNLTAATWPPSMVFAMRKITTSKRTHGPFWIRFGPRHSCSNPWMIPSYRVPACLKTRNGVHPL